MSMNLRVIACAIFVVLPAMIPSVGADEDNRVAHGNINVAHETGRAVSSVGEIHGNVRVGGRVKRRIWINGRSFNFAGPQSKSCNTVGSIGSKSKC